MGCDTRRRGCGQRTAGQWRHGERRGCAGAGRGGYGRTRGAGDTGCFGGSGSDRGTGSAGCRSGTGPGGGQ